MVETVQRLDVRLPHIDERQTVMQFTSPHVGRAQPHTSPVSIPGECRLTCVDAIESVESAVVNALGKTDGSPGVIPEGAYVVPFLA